MKKLALTLLLPLVATMLQGASAVPKPIYGKHPHTAASRIQRAWRNRAEIAQPDFDLFEKSYPSMGSKSQMSYLLDSERYDKQALKRKKAPLHNRMQVRYPKRNKIVQLWNLSPRRNKWLMKAIANAHHEFVIARMNNFPWSGEEVPMMTRGMFEAFSRAVQARLCDAFARLADDKFAVISYAGGKSDMVSMTPPEGYTVDNLYQLYTDLWKNMDPGVQEAFRDYLKALTDVSMQIKRRLRTKFGEKISDVRMENSKADLSYDAAHQALVQKGMQEIIADGFLKLYDHPMISGYAIDDIADHYRDGPVQEMVYLMDNTPADLSAEWDKEIEDNLDSDMSGRFMTHKESGRRGLFKRTIDAVTPQPNKDRAIRESQRRADMLPHTMGL